MYPQDMSNQALKEAISYNERLIEKLEKEINQRNEHLFDTWAALNKLQREKDNRYYAQFKDMD